MEEQQAVEQERSEILQQYEDWLEGPLVLLGFAWLILLVLELTRGVTPLLEKATTVIWILFIADFLIRFTLAPRKMAYLKSNWLTAISLAVPALRVLRFARTFRLIRAARATRGLRLLRLVTSVNRGMKALGASMRRRGFSYVLGLSILVLLSGAAGMYAFEKSPPGQTGIDTYGAALWWTAMILTTMGSEYWPRTPEGRMLCVFLALYAFAVFGYVTAALASFFIGRDAEDESAEIARSRNISALESQVEQLRREIRALSIQVEQANGRK